ncbi:MAG: MBL fold metallo-hydrolase [Gammaproteobacteria bacterium]|nr:MBL fold metallo-hydrolase [Gammaproteobacteria bacterium]
MGRAGRIVVVVVVASALIVGVTAFYVLGTRHGQDLALERAVSGILAAGAPTRYDGLRVFLCGTGSPLPGRAQACVAITAGKSLYLVDSGAGSPAVMQMHGQPMARLRAILLTHLHSDHITGIPDMNLASWVMGRTEPLRILGPAGTDRVVRGYNEVLALDRGFRVAHHGIHLLAPELGVMHAETVEPGIVVEDNGLVITAFAVNHEPITPAYGYRFDYRGRSVVVSGDTVVTDSLEAAARGADLLLHDVLSMRIVGTMQAAATAVGASRPAKIFSDIPTYHAHAVELGPLAERTGVRMLAVYHFVPPPVNYLMERIYRHDLPGETVLTRDGTEFKLPAESTAIDVTHP